MEWLDYMIMAAAHSKNNAQHWFRYLRKDIEKCGTLFSKEDVEKLSNNKELTPFQSVSLKAAFREGSQTRQHIMGLNKKVKPNRVISIKGERIHVSGRK